MSERKEDIKEESQVPSDGSTALECREGSAEPGLSSAWPLFSLQQGPGPEMQVSYFHCKHEFSLSYTFFFSLSLGF